MSDSTVRGCFGDCVLLGKLCVVCQRDHDDLFNMRKAQYDRLDIPKPPVVTESPLIRGLCATTGCSNRGYFNDDDAYCVTCTVAINHHARASSQRHELAMESQVGGNHYSKLAIQPVEYIHKNKIPFIEGSVIKYVTRWRDKGGIKDLQKAKHFIELLIELENNNVGKAD